MRVLLKKYFLNNILCLNPINILNLCRGSFSYGWTCSNLVHYAITDDLMLKKIHESNMVL